MVKTFIAYTCSALTAYAGIASTDEASAFDGQTKRFACEAGDGVEIVPVSFKGKKAKVGKVAGSGKLNLLFWY